MVAAVGYGTLSNGIQPVQASGEKYWSHFSGATVTAAPAVQESTIYYADEGGTITALNKSSQIRRWEFSTEGPIRSSPIVVDGSLFVGSQDGTIYAVDTESGKPQWRLETDGAVDSSPVVVEGTVFIGSDDENLYAIDAATGEQRWIFETDGRIKSSPVVVNQTVFFGSWDNAIYAVDATTGRERWSVRTNGRIETSPTVSNGTVYACSSDNSVYALNIETGDEEWRYEIPTGGLSTPTVGDVEPHVRETVYVQDQLGTLHALNAQLGGERWEFNLVAEDQRRSQEPITAPAIVQNAVIFGNQSGLYSVDGGSGEIDWKTTDHTSSAPLISKGTVYLGSEEDLIAKDAVFSVASADLSRTWLVTFGHPIEWKYAGQTIENLEEDTPTEEPSGGNQQDRSTESFDREPEVEDIETTDEQSQSSEQQPPKDSTSTSTTSSTDIDTSLLTDPVTVVLVGFVSVCMLTIGWIFGKLSGSTSSVDQGGSNNK